MRAIRFAVVIFLCMTSMTYAQLVSTFVYPIDPGYTFGGICPGGFKPFSYHMYYDSDSSLKGHHMGEDWNGYLSSGSSCGNSDEGATVRAIGDGTIFSATNQGNGRGNVLIIRYTLPDDQQTVMYVAYYHLQSFLQTSGSVYAGKPVATLGKSGTTFAHLHWEVVYSSSTSQGINPWHDICATQYQIVSGFCRQDSLVDRPFITGTNAMRYLAPSLLVESRMFGITIALQGTNSPSQFTVGSRAPGALAYVSNTQGVKKSINNAVAAGWISYGLLRKDPDNVWRYYTDSNMMLMKSGTVYAIWPKVSGLGLSVNYPSSDQDSMDDLARLDMTEAAYVAGFKYIDPAAMMRNPPYAPSDPAYNFYSMPMTKTTNASKGDANFKHQVLYAQHKNEPWLHRYTLIWDADTGSWTSWAWRGNTLP